MHGFRAQVVSQVFFGLDSAAEEKSVSYLNGAATGFHWTEALRVAGWGLLAEKHPCGKVGCKAMQGLAMA